MLFPSRPCPSITLFLSYLSPSCPPSSPLLSLTKSTFKKYCSFDTFLILLLNTLLRACTQACVCSRVRAFAFSVCVSVQRLQPGGEHGPLALDLRRVQRRPRRAGRALPVQLGRRLRRHVHRPGPARLLHPRSCGTHREARTQPPPTTAAHALSSSRAIPLALLSLSLSLSFCLGPCPCIHFLPTAACLSV